MRGWQFKNTIDVLNPITKETVREPMKPFMVSQLQILFERERIMLSPYDEHLYKQLIDYEVIKQTVNGNPVFTAENEHFIDALGLAYLAFVLEFSELTKSIKKPEFTSKIMETPKKLGEARVNLAIADAQRSDSFKNRITAPDTDDLRGDRQVWHKVAISGKSSSSSSWGSRRGSSSRSGGRSSW